MTHESSHERYAREYHAGTTLRCPRCETLEAEVAKLQCMYGHSCARVVAQSELLTRSAELRGENQRLRADVAALRRVVVDLDGGGEGR